MDPASIVEGTERTRFWPQTDGRTDKVKPVYPSSTSLSGCIITTGINSLRPSEAYRHHWTGSLDQVMGCHKFCVKSSPKPLSVWPEGTEFSEIWFKRSFSYQENAFGNVVCKILAILSMSNDLYDVIEHGQCWFIWWFVTCSVPSQYRQPCRLLDLYKKNLVEIESNHKIFFQGNAFGNVVCNMADILFRPQLLKGINYHIYLDTKYCRWNLIIVDDKRPRSIEATTVAALSIVS